MLAITPVVDPQKGEGCLVERLEIDQAKLRARLHETGELEFRHLSNPAGRAIPVPATGKLDLAEGAASRSDGGSESGWSSLDRGVIQCRHDFQDLRFMAGGADPELVRFAATFPASWGQRPGYKPTRVLRRRRTQAPVQVLVIVPAQACHATFLSRLRCASAQSARRAMAQ